MTEQWRVQRKRNSDDMFISCYYDEDGLSESDALKLIKALREIFQKESFRLIKHSYDTQVVKE